MTRTGFFSPRSGLWRRLSVLLGFACVLWVSLAKAEGRHRVVVLEQREPDPLAAEVLQRLKGELFAADFEVVPLPLEDADDPRAVVETAARSARPAAVFALGSTTDGRVQTLRLWMSDRVSDKIFVQQWQGDPAISRRVASVLAVQGVELVRARLADWSIALPPRLGEKPQPALNEAPVEVQPATQPGNDHSGPFMKGGVGLLYTLSSRKAAYAPTIGLGYRGNLPVGESTKLGLGIRLGAAGLGSHVDLSAPAGRARVAQSYALLDGTLSLAPEAWLQPFASVGVGVYSLRIEGSGEVPFYGRTIESLTPLSSVGLGLAIEPFEYWAWLLEAQGLFAYEPRKVRIDDVEAATFGKRLLVVSLSFAVLL